MTDRKQMARMAAMVALRTRNKAGATLGQAICVYDLAEHLGIEVRFLDIPSMEGFYSKNPGPLILLSTLRPAGRRVFTCAHELGHHVLGHGTRRHVHMYVVALEVTGGDVELGSS